MQLVLVVKIEPSDSSVVIGYQVDNLHTPDQWNILVLQF